MAEHGTIAKRLFVCAHSRESFLNVLEGRGGSRSVIEPLGLIVSQSQAGLGTEVEGCKAVDTALMDEGEREWREMEVRWHGEHITNPTDI